MGCRPKGLTNLHKRPNDRLNDPQRWPTDEDNEGIWGLGDPKVDEWLDRQMQLTTQKGPMQLVAKMAPKPRTPMGKMRNLATKEVSGDDDFRFALCYQKWLQEWAQKPCDRTLLHEWRNELKTYIPRWNVTPTRYQMFCCIKKGKRTGPGSDQLPFEAYEPLAGWAVDIYCFLGKQMERPGWDCEKGRTDDLPVGRRLAPKEGPVTLKQAWSLNCNFLHCLPKTVTGYIPETGEPFWEDNRGIQVAQATARTIEDAYDAPAKEPYEKSIDWDQLFRCPLCGSGLSPPLLGTYKNLMFL